MINLCLPIHFKLSPKTCELHCLYHATWWKLPEYPHLGFKIHFSKNENGAKMVYRLTGVSAVSALCSKATRNQMTNSVKSKEL